MSNASNTCKPRTCPPLSCTYPSIQPLETLLSADPVHAGAQAAHAGPAGLERNVRVLPGQQVHRRQALWLRGAPQPHASLSCLPPLSWQVQAFAHEPAAPVSLVWRTFKHMFSEELEIGVKFLLHHPVAMLTGCDVGSPACCLSHLCFHCDCAITPSMCD